MKIYTVSSIWNDVPATQFGIVTVNNNLLEQFPNGFFQFNNEQACQSFVDDLNAGMQNSSLEFVVYPVDSNQMPYLTALHKKSGVG